MILHVMYQIYIFSCCFTSSIVEGQQREEGEWPVVRCQTEKGGGVVVDWVPNRARRPAGRVSFAQTGRRSRPRQARTLQYSRVPDESESVAAEIWEWKDF